MWSMVMISLTFSTGIPNASLASEKVRYLPASEELEDLVSGVAVVSMRALITDGLGFSTENPA